MIEPDRKTRRAPQKTGARLTWIKGEKYVIHLISIFDSPAYRVLRRAAEKILRRLEIELSRHAGKDNGRLVVTFAQFFEYGVHRNAIAPAIRELVALGFIEVIQQGRAGNADFRRPSQYRITYLPTDDADPTHEWRRISTDEAEMIAQGARRGGRNLVIRTPPKKQNPAPGKRTNFGTETVPSVAPESVPPNPGKRTKNPPPKAYHYLPVHKEAVEHAGVGAGGGAREAMTKATTVTEKATAEVHETLHQAGEEKATADATRTEGLPATRNLDSHLRDQTPDLRKALRIVEQMVRTGATNEEIHASTKWLANRRAVSCVIAAARHAPLHEKPSGLPG